MFNSVKHTVSCIRFTTIPKVKICVKCWHLPFDLYTVVVEPLKKCLSPLKHQPWRYVWKAANIYKSMVVVWGILSGIKIGHLYLISALKSRIGNDIFTLLCPGKQGTAYFSTCIQIHSIILYNQPYVPNTRIARFLQLIMHTYYIALLQELGSIVSGVPFQLLFQDTSRHRSIPIIPHILRQLQLVAGCNNEKVWGYAGRLSQLR